MVTILKQKLLPYSKEFHLSAVFTQGI